MSESLLLCSSFIFSLCRACVIEESRLNSRLLFQRTPATSIPSERGEPVLQSKGSYLDAPKLQILKIGHNIKIPDEQKKRKLF